MDLIQILYYYALIGVIFALAFWVLMDAYQDKISRDLLEKGLAVIGLIMYHSSPMTKVVFRLLGIIFLTVLCPLTIYMFLNLLRTILKR
jgi:hypothetical protein